ncbi:unnamed protein product, partial [Prunus brigantina]
MAAEIAGALELWCPRVRNSKAPRDEAYELVGHGWRIPARFLSDCYARILWARSLGFPCKSAADLKLIEVIKKSLFLCGWVLLNMRPRLNGQSV